MKKAKRFLTGLLSAALALSLCAMPAMAADNGETPPTTTPNPVWTQDYGSITIHKYEWNEETENHATGEEDASQLPSIGEGENKKEPTPLKDATFAVYKIKNAQWLKEYYDGDPSKKNIGKLEWSDYAVKDGNAYKLIDDLDPKPELIGTEKTNASGLAKFENLELGLYLVIETKAPDSVKEACVPFFVSVPMTKVNDSKTNKLSDWLYDIHVYPKNSTSYGKATLQKIGKQSGNNTEVTTMQGYKFKLYKKNNDGAWTWIERKPANGVDNAGEWLDADNKTGVLTTGTEGKISVSGLTKGVYAFVETGVNASDGYILDSGIAYVFKINDNGEMVAATNTDVVNEKYPENATSFNFTAFSETEVKVKNYKPDFKKEIKDNKDADYGIGDDVPYTLTVNVPENVAKLRTFTVSDEMDSRQLVYNGDVVVKGKKSTETEAAELANSAYTLTPINDTENHKSGFTIAFNTKAIADYAGSTITITYSAKLQDGASVGEAGNVNRADLKYSKKTDITTEDDPPYDIHDEAVVYTFKTGILKKGDDDELLDNVEFTLYKKYNADTDTTYEENNVIAGVVFKGEKKPFLADAEAKKLGLNATEDPNTKWFAVMDLTTGKTGEKGTAVANGLPNGEYKLVETKTREGYNLLTGPVDANLTLDYATKWEKKETFNNEGKLIKHEYTSTAVTVGGAPYEYEAIVIINRKGFNLPTTGGFGTLLFSGIGVLLVVAGVGVLLSLKKKNRA